MPPIPNMMKSPRRPSTDARDTAARNKFDEFLHLHTATKTKLQFSNLRVEHVTEELMGSFNTFLFDRVQFSTAINHISSVRRQLETATGTRLFKDDPGWYKSLRSTLRSKYSARAKADGTTLTKSVPAMTPNDLCVISAALFKRNTATALRDRTLLLWQWNVLGRSSDITRVGFAHIRWLPSGMNMDVSRIKTSCEQTVSVVCSPMCWQTDAIHGLASQLAADPFTPSPMIFTQLAGMADDNTGVHHINSVLQDVSTGFKQGEVTAALRSHSSRRGAATTAASSSDVNTSDIAYRGNWSTSALTAASLYTYIAETGASDLKVARVLAGWENPKHDVHHPRLAPLGVGVAGEDADTQRLFGAALFRHFLPRLHSQPFVEGLTASLLLYYEDTHAVMPDHKLHEAMKAALLEVVPSLDPNRAHGVLLQWCTSTRKMFIIDNMTGLPPSVLQENLTEEQKADSYVSVSTFEDVMKRVLTSTQMLVGHVLDLTTEIRALKAQNGHLTTTIEALQQPLAHFHRALGVARADEQQQPPPTSLRLNQLPKWPKNLRTMKGVRFADCIYQCFWEDLEKVPRVKGSKSESNAQSECMKAFGIAKQYISKDEMPRPYASMRNEDEQLAWSTHVRALAESVEARVIKDLTDGADRPKKRKRTTFVSATIREHYKQSKARKAKNSVN